MNIQDLIGEVIDEPIRSNTAIGDVRTLWDRPQLQRLKNQTMRSQSGKIAQYTLLYFIPGLTTYCGIRGTPVLTGYMSGCYLFRFRHNGELRAAHVGTHDNLTDWSDKAKTAWKWIANNPQVSDVFGFDPLKDVSLRLLSAAQKVGTPQVVGIWEGNGSARVAVFANSHAHLGKKVFVGMEPAPLRPWSSIQNDPKMQ
ncbi:MAG: hypothetical protein JF593_12215 [Novosphingobium sp.]|nr:hypothetical protein [Novosphingobium sp.]